MQDTSLIEAREKRRFLAQSSQSAIKQAIRGEYQFLQGGKEAI